MPIKDRSPSPSLTKLGRIHLGEKTTTKNGKMKLTNLDYFRIVADDPVLQAEIDARYGAEPRALFVYPLGSTADEVVNASYRRWTAGNLLLCRGDGERISRAFTQGKGSIQVVKNGVCVTAFEDGGQAFEPGDTVPCPGSRRDLYNKCLDCTIHSIMRFIVRDPHRPADLIGDAFGYFDISNKSPVNWETLTGQLMTFELVARNANKDLMALPLILQRVVRQMPVTTNKGRFTKDTALLDLQLDHQHTKWIGSSLLQAGSSDPHALPAVVEGQVVDAQQIDETDWQPATHSQLVQYITEDTGWFASRQAVGKWLRKKFENQSLKLEDVPVEQLWDLVLDRNYD